MTTLSAKKSKPETVSQLRNENKKATGKRKELFVELIAGNSVGTRTGHDEANEIIEELAKKFPQLVKK